MTSFCGSCHWSQDWWELWVFYRHGKKHCLWAEIRGEEKCSLWRWWFGLFLGPRSIVMILLIKFCWTQFGRGMSFWTGAVCRHWLITTGLTWKKKHSTQNFPSITRENVFPDVHHLPPAQPTTSRTKWKVPTTSAQSHWSLCEEARFCVRENKAVKSWRLFILWCCSQKVCN